MMIKTHLLSLVLLMMPVAALAQDEGGPPEVSLEGLELVEKNRRGELYADPGIDWSVYQQVQLDPATVAFRKNWKRDQNRYQYNKIRDSDVERMKTGLSELFGETFHRNDGAGLWVLHVWLWNHNPAGLFADWNPTVSCP